MNTPPLLAVLAVAATLTVSGCAATPDTAPSSTPTNPDQAEPRLDDTSQPPWPAPTDIPARVASAGLDLGPMGTAEHYHPHLRILIDGTDIPVPPNIGVDPSTGAMSALHTHEGDGTIHIEADTEGEIFTLGQLFAQWGVMLTSRQIGGVRAEPGARLEVTSNGAVVTGDPRDLQLEPDQKVVLSLG